MSPIVLAVLMIRWASSSVTSHPASQRSHAALLCEHLLGEGPIPLHLVARFAADRALPVGVVRASRHVSVLLQATSRPLCRSLERMWLAGVQMLLDVGEEVIAALRNPRPHALMTCCARSWRAAPVCTFDGRLSHQARQCPVVSRSRPVRPFARSRGLPNRSYVSGSPAQTTVSGKGIARPVDFDDRI